MSERAGDAVEVCLATLYFSTMYPVQFRFWGDPFENYAGLEHSIRSFAVSTGCISTNEVTEMGKALATVLGTPTVIITMEEYYAVLKKMKDGPIEPTQTVKDEPEGDVTDFSAGIGVVDANIAEEDDAEREEMATASPQTEAEQDAPDESRAPETPASTKKRRIGAMLEGLMMKADAIKVCPVCWIQHSDHSCPRAAEGEALYTALAPMRAGGAPPPADVPAGSTSAIATEPDMAASGEDMGVDAAEQRPDPT